MTAMSSDEYQQLYAAITALRGEINNGLAGVTLAIATLSESFHKSLVEQERRNSSFATTTRLEELDRSVNDCRTQLAGREERFERIDADLKRQDVELGAIRESLETRGQALTGYIAMAFVSAGGTTLAFVLAHLAHV